MWLRPRNAEEKDVCPFLLLENSRPLSPWGPPDFLSTCLGVDSLLYRWSPHMHIAQSSLAMAPHSSVLAWRNPGMGEPGGLPSMGLHRVGHDWSDLAAAAAQSLNWVVCCVIISSRLREKNCFMWLRLRNVKEKKVCPFLLLENSRPLSPPGEPQITLSSGTPRLLINLPRNCLPQEYGWNLGIRIYLKVSQIILRYIKF